MRAAVQTVRRALPVVAVVLVVTAGCTSPPAAGLPNCPVRSEVTLEPADPVNYSLVRAVSPDGGWVVLSHVEGDQLVLTLREVSAGSVPLRVGSLPYPAAPATYPPMVSVTSGGDQVAFGFAGTAAYPGAATEQLYRWTRSSGTVTELAPPPVVHPPEGVQYPSNARRLSADGTRAIWTNAFYVAPYGWNYVLTVVDLSTGQTVSQLPYTYDQAGILDGTTSSDARLLTNSTGQFDTTTGAVRLLTPELDAAQAHYGGGRWSAVASSASGRWVLVQAGAFGASNRTVNALVDSTSGVVSELPSGNLGSSITLTDQGAMVVSVESAASSAVYVRDADGAVHVLVDRALAPTWPEFSAPRLGASADTRTVVFSTVEAVGNRLAAERCT